MGPKTTFVGALPSLEARNILQSFMDHVLCYEKEPVSDSMRKFLFRFLLTSAAKKFSLIVLCGGDPHAASMRGFRPLAQSDYDGARGRKQHLIYGLQGSDRSVG